MGGKRFVLGFFAVFTFIFLLSGVHAYSFYATTNKLVYTSSDTLSISGNITNTLTQINMTATISNSTPIFFYSMSSNSSGSNLFSVSQSLSGVPAGTYNVTVASGTNSIIMSIEVVSSITYLETHLVDSQDIRSIDTSATITADDAMGGNFSELRDLSISGTLHYGNSTLDRLYHFVLVDQNYNQTYDTLYADDDIIFQLYNDTEDSGQNSSTERILSKGQKLGDYMVGEIEHNTGSRIILGKPKGSSVYSAGSAVNFIVMAKDSDKNLVPGIMVQARLLNSSKGVVNAVTNTTNSMGFFIANFTAPAAAGTYTIDLNNSRGSELFTVESFKLSGKVTDLSDNPTSSFTPNSVARVYATSRDSDGNAVNLSSSSVRITYPNGNSAVASLVQSETGMYYYDFATGDATGSSGVKVTGSYNGSTQEFITGFSVESTSMQVMAMNMNFIDQAGEGGSEVNAFAPQGNITLVIFLSNISAGGMMANGPEGMGLIDIDNESTGTDECGTLVSMSELRDDRGVVTSPSYSAVNLSRAIAMSGVSMEEQPPQSVMRQCVIIFAAPNRTGTYKAVAQINYNGEMKKAGATFGVQRLYAEGASVDSKGDDYWFFAPNTTMKIKLKIKDLASRQDLPPQNITSAKIMEIHKEFPNYQDIFTESFRASANESVQNGTLVFNAPDAEGFFSMKFKFKAFVNGTEETGIGNAFFQLKKYMIWAAPQCNQEGGGPCISGMGKNVTLTVNVIDIDQGSMMSQMGKGTSSLTCTDCDGLLVDVGSLRNDQLMKDMAYGTDYYVVKGVVSNATANLTIVPLSAKMQNGWYGMDLIATDMANANNTYFGWGGFEIRNIYVEAMKVSENGGNLTASKDMGPVFQKGGSVTFAVAAKDPSTDDMLQVSSASLESLKWMVGWPPAEIPNSTVSVSISTMPVYVEWSQQPMNMTVVNISGLDKDGDFQANVRVVTSKGSDIGSFFFGLSTYNIEISYRGMDEWKSPFSSSENLTVTFTGMGFGGQPYNLSQAGSKLRSIYNDKTGNPIRINTSVTNCTGNICIITTPLSSLSSGWYGAEYSINDTQGYEKTQKVQFMIQNMIVGIPSIEEAWVGNQDTTSKDVDINNDRDRCDNQRNFNDNFVAGLWNNSQIFCIQTSGEWSSQPCGGVQGGTNITVLSNGSELNIGGTNHTVGQGFSTAGGKNWTIVSISPQGPFEINNTDGICGEMQINCGMEGCEQIGYVMASPGSHTTFYHGHLDSLVSENQYNGGLSGGQTRSLYFYHNTSYLWVSVNVSNMTQLGGPYTVGGTFNDSYGGQWKVNAISKNKINIVGLNVLAGSGAYINVSKSKSGVIKIGQLEEFRLGGWDKNTGNQRGLDLDNDSLTNGTVYVAISDSQTAGIYDTFFFFNATGNNAFSTALSVSDPNVNNRKFGLNNSNRVTLLSIDPRADRVRFYSDKMGDWADLGDFRMDGNVSIPIIVRSPNGSSASANVSINNIRVKGTGVNRIFSLPGSVPNATITGAGEVRIANVSKYSLGSGEYVFEIRAAVGQNSETLEEWKWPRASPRTFLVDGYTGQAAYVSGFKQLPIARYDGEIYGGDVPQIYTVNWTSAGKYFKAVLDMATGGEQVQNVTACSFARPASAGNNNSNLTLRSSRLTNPQYYYYITAANASRVWIKTGNCNFTANTTEYNAATTPTINVTKNGRTYMMRVLDADMGNGSVAIGIKSIDFPPTISPIRVNTMGWGGNQTESPTWYIMGLNISGTDYNVILANDSIAYPMCSVWNMPDCSKKAWFSTGDNFSQAIPVYAGENFTGQLYLTKIGPGPWEGVSIANFSLLGGLAKPAIDVRVKDSTTSYYGIFNEGSLNLDLNMDGDRTDVFYGVAYDDMDDGLQVLNQIIVDDDLQITEEWWSESDNQSDKKDFYGDEAGMAEKRSGLPNSIWQGNIWFGEQTNGSWEQQPQWRIEKYNNSDMLLLKDEWQINGSRNITILVRAYNFNQSAIIGANVSVSAIKGNMPGWGFIKLEQGRDYNLTANMTATNSDGYAMLRIIPVGTWSGEYMVDIQTTYNGNTETTNKWFRVM